MRDGRRKVTQPAIDVLLGSVDCLRTMLASIQAEESVDSAAVEKYKKALEIELSGSASELVVNASAATPPAAETAEPAAVKVADEAELAEQGWKIAFCPYLDLLKTGNDPVRMFRELAELGQFRVKVNTKDIPEFAKLDPEECNMSSASEVVGDIPLNDIQEIFNWVEGDCELDIQPLAKAAPKKAVPIAKPAEPESLPPPTEIEPPKPELPTLAAVAKETANPMPKPDAQQTDNDPAKSAVKAASTIRVDTTKIDTLINMVGES